MNKAPGRILFLFTVVFAFLATSLYADPLTIQGTARNYGGQTLTFFYYSNMVSFAERELGTCEVDDSGSFSCTFELEDIRLVFTRLGVYNGFFFAEPGMNYELRLPPRQDKTFEQESNPYFEAKSVHLSTSTARGEDLNFLMRAFDDYFYPVYYKFVSDAYGNNLNREDVNKTIEGLEETFDSIENPYFNDYLKYRVGLLKHYGVQMSNRRIIGDYFLGSGVKFFNPAYMELFNEVFQDYFKLFHRENPKKQLPLLLNREMDYTAVSALLEKDAGLSDKVLREMVMVKGLYDGLYDDVNIRSAMLQMLDSVKIHTGEKHIIGAVDDIKGKYTKLLPGYKPPDFALLDSDSNTVHLSDFKGKYVYLNFCNSFSYYCVKEYEYMKVLHQRMEGQDL